MELCSNDGETLKAFSLDECDGAPHEFRGVKRSTLLEALQSKVPDDCIEYGAAIHAVETDQNGTYLPMLLEQQLLEDMLHRSLHVSAACSCPPAPSGHL